MESVQRNVPKKQSVKSSELRNKKGRKKDDCGDGMDLNLQRGKRGDDESLSPGAVRRRDAVTGLYFPPSLATQFL